MEQATFLTEILSAGVVVALVTGIFSLVIAVRNNKRLMELENLKQKFTMVQERFKELKDAYKELLGLLPEDRLLGHVIMNMPSRPDFQENGLSEAFEIGEENMKILYSHFQKYSYLFSEDEKKKIGSAIEEIDDIAQNIRMLNSGTQTDSDEEEMQEIHSNIHEKILERILKVTEFEKMYYNLYSTNLRRISKMDSKN